MITACSTHVPAPKRDAPRCGTLCTSSTLRRLFPRAVVAHCELAVSDDTLVLLVVLSLQNAVRRPACAPLPRCRPSPPSCLGRGSGRPRSSRARPSGAPSSGAWPPSRSWPAWRASARRRGSRWSLVREGGGRVAARAGTGRPQGPASAGRREGPAVRPPRLSAALGLGPQQGRVVLWHCSLHPGTSKDSTRHAAPRCNAPQQQCSAWSAPRCAGVDVNAARYVGGRRETPNGEVGGRDQRRAPNAGAMPQ